MKVRKKLVIPQCLIQAVSFIEVLIPKKSQNRFSNNLESVLKCTVDGIKHKYNEIFGNSVPYNSHGETKFGNYNFFLLFSCLENAQTKYEWKKSPKWDAINLQLVCNVFFRNSGPWSFWSVKYRFTRNFRMSNT